MDRLICDFVVTRSRDGSNSDEGENDSASNTMSADGVSDTNDTSNDITNFQQPVTTSNSERTPKQTQDPDSHTWNELVDLHSRVLLILRDIEDEMLKHRLHRLAQRLAADGRNPQQTTPGREISPPADKTATQNNIPDAWIEEHVSPDVSGSNQRPVAGMPELEEEEDEFVMKRRYCQHKSATGKKAWTWSTVWKMFVSQT